MVVSATRQTPKWGTMARYAGCLKDPQVSVTDPVPLSEGIEFDHKRIKPCVKNHYFFMSNLLTVDS